MSEGVDAYQQKSVEKSVAALKAAEQFDFPDSAPYYFLATWFAHSSEIGEANDQINAGLISVPNDPQLLYEGMFVSLTAHDNTEAGRRFAALDRSDPDEQLTAEAGCLYYYGIGQPGSALPYCARQTQMLPNNHTAHSNYGWAALDANQVSLAAQEFSQAYKLASPNRNQLTDAQVIDLLWGITIFAGNHGELEARREQMRRSFVECKCGMGRKWSYPCPVCHAFVGTLEELGEVLVRSIGRYTEEEKKQIRNGLNRG